MSLCFFAMFAFKETLWDGQNLMWPFGPPPSGHPFESEAIFERLGILHCRTSRIETIMGLPLLGLQRSVFIILMLRDRMRICIWSSIPRCPSYRFCSGPGNQMRMRQWGDVHRRPTSDQHLFWWGWSPDTWWCGALFLLWRERFVSLFFPSINVNEHQFINSHKLRQCESHLLQRFTRLKGNQLVRLPS